MKIPYETIEVIQSGSFGDLHSDEIVRVPHGELDVA